MSVIFYVCFSSGCGANSGEKRVVNVYSLLVKMHACMLKLLYFTTDLLPKFHFKVVIITNLGQRQKSA